MLQRTLGFVLGSVGLIGGTSTAQQYETLVRLEDDIPNVGKVTQIRSFGVNEAGSYLVELDTDHVPTTMDVVVLRDGVLFLREGDPIAQPAGALIDVFDRLALDRAGNPAVNLVLDGLPLTENSGVYFNDQLILQEGAISTAQGFGSGTEYRTFLDVGINNEDSTLLVVATVDDPDPLDTGDRAIVRLFMNGSGGIAREDVVATEGIVFTVLVPQPPPNEGEPVLPPIPSDEMLEDIETSTHSFAFNDLHDVLYIGDVSGDTTVDHILVLNEEMLLQEGLESPLEGRHWNDLSSAVIDLNNNREWVIRTTVDGNALTNQVIVRNGEEVLVQRGDSLPAIAPFLITGFGLGPVQLTDADETLWFGEWDDLDPTRRRGLFLDEELLIQEGVTMIDGLILTTLFPLPRAYEISPGGRYVMFKGVLSDGTEGLFRLDRGLQATQRMRNGSGSNPICLSGATVPVPGEDWVIEVDTEVGTNVRLTGLLGHAGGTDDVFGVFGEILVDLASPKFIRKFNNMSGAVDTYTFSIPADPSLVGLGTSVQAFFLGDDPAQLCNALDATIGN